MLGNRSCSPPRVDAARVARLRQQIEDAFADVPYPGDDNIGYSDDSWDAREMAKKARGKHWRELDPLFLEVESPHFMSAAALQFYFPAYLFDAIQEDFLKAHSLVLLLRPYNNAMDEASVVEFVEGARYTAFDAAQRAAIRAFLECYRDWIEDHRAEWEDWFFDLWRKDVDVALTYVWGPEGYLERHAAAAPPGR